MRRILITGGAGYLGWSIIAELLKLPEVDEILVYDSLARKNHNLFTSCLFRDNKNVKFWHGDILDQRALSKALIGIDTVIHLAAKVNEPFQDVDSQQFEQTNHWGSAVLANEILKSSVNKVVYISSIYVYGTSSSFKTVLDNPKPTSFYGISKLRGEKQFSTILADKELYICRVGNIFGYNPTMRFDVIVNKLTFDAVHKGIVNIYGEGTQRRPFVEVNNAANKIVKAVSTMIETGVYNIVDKHYSILDVVRELHKILPELETRYINRSIKMQDVLVVDNSVFNEKSQDELLSNSIQKLVNKIY